MPKFTLICEHPEPGSEKTTVEFNAELLPQVLENFEMFLKGCGYVFTGDLDFFSEENSYEDSL